MEWIKSSDKMPEECMVVLVYIRNQSHINTALWERKEGWYESYENILIKSEVTHWMALPPLPNEEDVKENLPKHKTAPADQQETK